MSKFTVVKTFTVELSENEIDMIAYALNEMGGRRMEQAIDRKDTGTRAEADQHFILAAKVRAINKL